MKRLVVGSRWGWRLGRRWQSVGSGVSGSGVRDKEFDLVVIGGGSGGLACAKEASELGAKVAVVDFVAASPKGSTWGLGGTCVNVGCIPKKLMHHAALLGKFVNDAPAYGWNLGMETSAKTHDWEVLKGAVQMHIKSLNWGHRIQLKEKSVSYFNGFGSFLDKHRIQIRDKKGKEEVISGERVLVAVGLRPRYPDIAGSELGESSDDLFGRGTSPGRTLVVGGSYVALECAGLLAGLGLPTTVLMRSIPLRGFDQQMAELVLGQLVSEESVRLIRPAVPTSVARSAAGKLDVAWAGDAGAGVGTFDTVLWAIGREPRLGSMNLSAAGVELDPSNGRIQVDARDTTSVPSIHAIGDIASGVPELTPSAIMAGKLLARRLFSDSEEVMDYANVPTTVFTPLEYGSVGLTEEAAIAQHGEDGLEIQHAFFVPLEWHIPARSAAHCYVKVICQRDDDGRGRVLGLHLTGPNAGEIVQGFAAAIAARISWHQLKRTVGIHPTTAEEIVRLRITKRSGLDPEVTGC